MTSKPKLKLALIGKGIGESRAPELHRRAGEIVGVRTTYELIDLDGLPFDAFEAECGRCRAEGYAGINITHPFKERAVNLVDLTSADVRRLRALNTVGFIAPSAGSTESAGRAHGYVGRLTLFTRRR